MELERVYALRDDAKLIKDIQTVTASSEQYGLQPDPAVFGSPEWWTAVERGDLPTSRADGVISEVTWESMNDWPVFEMVDESGETTTWTRQGDLTRYSEGLMCHVVSVPQKLKPSAEAILGSLDTTVVLEIWLEPSRLRSCDIAPGPGGAGFRDLTTLYRPVGELELRLIEESEYRRFPPRLPHQPFFYPVITVAYATTIARDWNTKDPKSGFRGYVTTFHVPTEALSGYDVHQVGGHEHLEYWIPADDLDRFGSQFVGRIDVVAEYLPER